MRTSGGPNGNIPGGSVRFKRVAVLQVAPPLVVLLRLMSPVKPDAPALLSIQTAYATLGDGEQISAPNESLGPARLVRRRARSGDANWPIARPGTAAATSVMRTLRPVRRNVAPTCVDVLIVSSPCARAGNASETSNVRDCRSVRRETERFGGSSFAGRWSGNSDLIKRRNGTRLPRPTALGVHNCYRLERLLRSCWRYTQNRCFVPKSAGSSTGSLSIEGSFVWGFAPTARIAHRPTPRCRPTRDCRPRPRFRPRRGCRPKWRCCPK